MTYLLNCWNIFKGPLATVPIRYEWKCFVFVFVASVLSTSFLFLFINNWKKVNHVWFLQNLHTNWIRSACYIIYTHISSPLSLTLSAFMFGFNLFLLCGIFIFVHITVVDRMYLYSALPKDFEVKSKNQNCSNEYERCEWVTARWTCNNI